MTRASDKPMELLAPAGDRAAMKAAVANGADAVYFGLGQFSARARATNFSLEELPETIAFLHAHNVKGYVAFNTLIFSDELEQAVLYVTAIAAGGADAVIVQDLGLATLIGRLCPSLPLHASTQMTLSDARAVALAASLGVRRAILPRELSIAEIATIANATDLEVEVFAHGAMCISFSGQCWASQSFWGRSGNRGQCGQACRLPYQLVVNGHVAGDARRFLLSPKDLAAHDLVPQLMQAGVDGLKIEGRLKSEHYVAATCAVYRQALDAAAAGKEFKATARQERELAQGFSRGFSHGFLTGIDHADLVDGQSPKPRGLRLGTVARVFGGGAVVRLDEGAEAPKAGDGVVFEREPKPGSETGCSPQADDARVQSPFSEPGGRVYSVREARGAEVELTFDNALDLSAVTPGDVVWKTDDPRVRRDLEQTFARTEVRRPSALSVEVQAQAGRELRMTFRDDRGDEATVQSAQPMAAARTLPLTAEMLKEQLGRLGGTPFALGSVRLIGEAGEASRVDVLAPKSLLNQLRREAVARLIDLRAQRARHRIVEPGALEALRSENGYCIPSVVRSGNASVSATVHYLARTVAQVRALADCGMGIANCGLPHAFGNGAGPASAGIRNPQSEIRNAAAGLLYLDFAGLTELDEAISVASAANLPFAIATPRILKPHEEPLLEQLASRKPAAWLVRNLGSMSWLAEHCPQAELIGDAGLNVANELTARLLASRGLRRLTPAYDLPEGGLEAMAARSSAGLFEAVIHQHVPLFHMAHCLFARLSGASECGGCPHPCRQHDLRLRDRNGVDHPVRVDLAGRTTVFRGEVESHLGERGELRRVGVSHFRVELLDEGPEEVGHILRALA